MQKIVLLLVVALAINFSSAYSIFPGFVRIGELKGAKALVYLASNYPASQDDALVACQSFVGGRLATILSREEFTAVATMLPPSINDYTTYWTAGRNIDGTFTWLTTGEPIEESVLFWDGTGVYPIGTPGNALGIRKYANSIPTMYTDSWGPTALKKFVCEVSTQ